MLAADTVVDCFAHVIVYASVATAQTWSSRSPPPRDSESECDRIEEALRLSPKHFQKWRRVLKSASGAGQRTSMDTVRTDGTLVTNESNAAAQFP